MQAIVTKFLGPTNRRGSRIKATTSSGYSLTTPYNHTDRNAHFSSAEKLIRKLGWHGDWISGDTKNGMVFVRVTNDPQDVLTVRE